MALSVSMEEIVALNANGLLGCPPSWRRVKLGEVAKVKNGAAFKSSFFNQEGRGMPLLRIRDVPSDRTVAFYDGPFDEEFVVERGDLIIGMDGDFNCALWRGPRALLNQRVCRVDLDERILEPRFVRWLLPSYLEAVNDVTSSVTVKHLSSKTVAAIPLPCPPVEEQRQVADRLDHIDQTIRDADRRIRDADKLAEDLAAAYMAAAFENSGQTRPLDELAEVQSGITKGRPKDDTAFEVPYIRTANVQAGFLDLDEVKTIPATSDQVERHQLADGDVLVLEGGDADKVGRGWVWHEEVPGAIHQNHVFAVRPREDLLDSLYLGYFINSPAARAYFLSRAKQTTNLASINKTQLRSLPVPILPLNGQHQTVTRLEKQLESVRQLRLDLAARRREEQPLWRAILSQLISGPSENPRRVPSGGLVND